MRIQKLIKNERDIGVGNQGWGIIKDSNMEVGRVRGKS
jgi:hypothetical protein